MLTTNIDIADRLINGQIGSVAKIIVNQDDQKPTVIFVKFDDHNAGNISIQKCGNLFARQNSSTHSTSCNKNQSQAR